MRASIMRCFGIAAAACLAACASTQPKLYYAVYDAKDALKQPYLRALANDFKDSADRSRENSGDPALAGKFLESGMALTDLLCLEYFNRSTKNHQHRGFAKTMLNDTNGLVSAIMGLTQAGSLATGAVGAGFSYANSTAENVENTYMVSVDMASAQTLTQQAMSELEEFNESHPPKSRYSAERALARYASVCTFTGIHGLVAESIRASQVEVDASGKLNFKTGEAGKQKTTEPTGTVAK